MGNDRRLGDDRVGLNCVNWPRLHAMAEWMGAGSITCPISLRKRMPKASGRCCRSRCGLLLQRCRAQGNIARRGNRQPHTTRLFVIQINLHEPIKNADFHGDEREERGRPKMALPFASTTTFVQEAVGDGPPDSLGSGGGDVWQVREGHDGRHADPDCGKALHGAARGRLPALPCAARTGVSRSSSMPGRAFGSASGSLRLTGRSSES